VTDILANEIVMKISKPNKLLKAVSYSFFSLLAGFYLIGGFYSLQEPTESVWENHTHTSLSFHSDHSHFPLNFFSALINESVEETEDDVHESKPVAVQVSESFFPCLPTIFHSNKLHYRV